MFVAPLLFATLFHAHAQATTLPMQVTHGNLRIQIYSPILIRIEEKGPNGFEDRSTLTVVNRPQNIPELEADSVDLGDYKLTIPDSGKAEDVSITDKTGNEVYRWDGKPVTHSFLPGPSADFKDYVIEDNPRLVPPAWGATPAPEGNTMFPQTSGWDTTNDAPDIYVFLKGPGGYKDLRKQFLDLTGHTPMPPLAAFGFWDSRYYEYKQQEALDLIDEYRAKDFPLDFFVVDTDWRVNGSHGYAVNTADFPNMEQFIQDAHAKHVHLMYNDHPEPITENALAPEEMAYRWKGLSELLDWGADVWWYDRNWSTHLHQPMPGIAPEMWGDVLYHDMTLRAHPNQRPMIMSNVQGIDNGERHYAPAPAFHRYPIWWTGDTGAYFKYLKWGIANGVDSGVMSLLPYVNEDLGGHWAHPTPELYVRYLEYGCLAPITRIHCTKGEDRHPWTFGDEAENIVRKYIKMRYRLLPTIYAAAHRAYTDGTPLMRRCDLEWPQYKEASDDQQFMLGDDILVAPTNESVTPDPKIVSGDLLKTNDGQPGLTGEYFPNTSLSGAPVITRVDKTIDFNWNAGSPADRIPKENFSIRWSGTLGPVPETGDYHVAVRVDDGCRLFVDGKELIDDWNGHSETTDSATVHLDKGQSYDLRLEYLQLSSDDSCHLEWTLPSEVKTVISRTLWIPPGIWESAWTGKLFVGPQMLTTKCPLSYTPMFVRHGGIVLTGPNETYTGEKPWDQVTAEVYPIDFAKTVTRRLYEDDGASNAYLTGQFRTTAVSTAGNGKSVQVKISPTTGDYNGGPTERGWILRIHLATVQKVTSVVLDGRETKTYAIFHPAKSHVDMPFEGAGSKPGLSAGDVVEIRIGKSKLSEGHRLIVNLKKT
ncbi:MAG TPA: TIM-barrel domain-containing protein [Fimbriimonadaceae bacterium]|jgi:hypothetical protein